MKKIIAICMAALLLLAALPVSLVLADGEAKIYAVVDKATACAGQEIKLTVKIDNNPGVAGWQIYVAFDTDALELTAQDKSADWIVTGANYGFGKIEKQSPANCLWGEFGNGVNYDMNGDLFTMTFKVKEGAADGDYTFDVYVKDDADICNVDFDNVAHTVDDVSVKVGHNYTESVTAATCGANGEKKYTCSACGDSYSEVIPATGEHTYANACDADCNVCGAGRTPADHVYDNACDASCNVCGANRVAAAHVYDNACDKDCNVCGAERTVADHVYTDACDVDCNECGATRTAPHSYAYACDKVCELCGEETNPSADHNIVHMEAVEPDCHYIGHVEHWYCSHCGATWTNEELTEVSNKKSVIVPALGGDVIHVEAVEATEDKEGNIEYWFCEKCDQFWTDEALTQLTNSKNVITPKKDPVPPTTTKPTEPTKPNDGKNPIVPGMGENVVVIVLAGMIALIAAAAVVLFSKKKA